MDTKIEIGCEDSLTNGTSYHFEGIRLSKDEIVEKVGEPVYEENDDDAKVQNEWNFKYTDEDGTEWGLTLYDWKEYRYFGDGEKIMWHIGRKGDCPVEAVTALIDLLTK